MPFSGTGGIWAMKAGDFVPVNFPGTSVGLGDAITYVGSNGLIEVYPGNAAISIPTSIPAGVRLIKHEAGVEYAYGAGAGLISAVANVREFGAKGDGNPESPVAIQAAIDTGRRVYFPKGNYNLTGQVTFSTLGQMFFGDGPQASIITLSGTNKGFVSSGPDARCTFRDLQITGATGTSHGIDLSSGEVIWSSFENLWIDCGGKGIYIPNGFSNHFENCRFGSKNDNGVEVKGGAGTSFINCFGNAVPTAGKCVYRVYLGATFIGCMSTSSVETAVILGQKVAEDGIDTECWGTFVGCNFENFTKQGIRAKFHVELTLTGTWFIAPTSGTYDCAINVDEASLTEGVFVIGCEARTKGATRNKMAEVFATGPVRLVTTQSNFQEWLKYDQNGTLKTAAVLGTTNGRGDNIASAATIAIPATGDVFHVTGSTNITTGITVAATDGGRQVTLIFDGTLTVSATGTSKLAGNFPATPDDALMMACDGTNWYEVSRSAN